MMAHKSHIQLNHIYNLIRHAENPEIQNFHQLCRKLFGGKRCTWLVFERLMYWMNYSMRSDGSIYKSAKELAEEIGCVEKTVDRAIPALQEVAFDIYIKKANGAPTRHFKVNPGRLVRKLAEVFEIPLEDALFMMELERNLYLEDENQEDDRTIPMWDVEKKRVVSMEKVSDSDIFPPSNQVSSPNQEPRYVSKEEQKMSGTSTRTTSRNNIFVTLPTNNFAGFCYTLAPTGYVTQHGHVLPGTAIVV